MMCHRIGRPPISTIGFGRTSVSSASRVPRPPARIATFIPQHVLLGTVQTDSIDTSSRPGGALPTNQHSPRDPAKIAAMAGDPEIGRLSRELFDRVNAHNYSYNFT